MEIIYLKNYITLIQPLFLAHPEQEMEHEGSKLVVAITAKMEDYLAKRDSGKIVKGEKGFQNVDTIWTFVVQNGKWVLILRIVVSLCY
ncbi:MAG: hypothetical protein ABFS56_10640 [Pseudomonadota bacterium]